MVPLHKQNLKCAGCGNDVDRLGGTRTHVELSTQFHLCGNCFKNEKVWRPLVDKHFGEAIERNKQEFKGPKKKSKKKVNEYTGGYYDTPEKLKEARQRGQRNSKNEQ